MKRILLVTNQKLDKAGVQAVILDIARRLKDEYRFDILLITERTGFYDEEFCSLGGEIFRIPNKKNRVMSKVDYYLRGKKLYNKTLKILKENGPYVAVHCHNEYEAGPCLAAAKKAGIPVRIAHTHIVHSKTHLLHTVFEKINKRLIEKNATHKFGCSSEACYRFYENSETATVLKSPYDSQRFYFGKYEEKELNQPSILQVGSFCDNKNQLFSLDVIAEIKKTYPNVQFNMVGFDLGGISDQINNKIKTLGLEKNVNLHQSDADTPKLLSESSHLIFPSKREGFGIVAIEAQAMGVKCFASNTIPEATNRGGCEYLPLSEGPAYWAKKMIEDFKTTGGKHREYDCSPYAAENVVKEYRRIYGGNQIEAPVVEKKVKKDLRFSILVPVYNVEKYLPECIESVLAQTYKNYELILVDDGSTDNSGKICDEYAENHPCIKVFHKENGGLLHTRRVAFQKASGDYYICLDSDDSIVPETLQTIYNVVNSYDADCIIYEFKRHLNGEPIEFIDETKPTKVITDKRELLLLTLFNHRYNSMCRKAVKASLIKDLNTDNLLDIAMGEDLLQSLEIFKNTEKTVVIPNALYNYRMNDQSITHSHRYDNYDVSFTLHSEELKFLQELNAFNEKDIIAFRRFNRGVLVYKLKTISRMETPYKNKVELFNKIKSTNYYNEFLNETKDSNAAGAANSAMYFLFKCGWYPIIILIVQITKLKKILLHK